MRIGWLFIFALILAEVSAQTPGSHYGMYLNNRRANIVIPSDSSLNFSGAITVEAWIKPDSFTSSALGNYVVSKHGAYGGFGLRCLRNRSVEFLFRSASSSSWRSITSTKKLDVGEWYHVAGTYDGDSLCLYINGKRNRFRFDTSGLGAAGNLNLRIGQYSNSSSTSSGGRVFYGEIDEVRVWSAAINRLQMRKWALRKVAKNHPYYKHLRGNWRFDEGSGSVVYDQSVYQNHGSHSNVSYTRSNAPIGDSTMYAWGNALEYTTAQGDRLHLTFWGRPKDLYLYQVKESAIDPLAGAFMNRDSQYFGVFSADSSALNYRLTYHYHDKNPFTSNGNCFLEMMHRNERKDKEWQILDFTHHTQGDSLTARLSAHEFHLGKYFDERRIFIKDNDSTLCQKDVARLTAFGDSSFRFQWYENNQLLSGDTLSFITASKQGTFQVSVQKDSTCSYKSSPLSLTFLNLPKVTLNPITPLCDYSDTLVLTGGKPVGGNFSGWPVVRDSLIIPRFFGPGNYDVMYTYTDSNGCSATDTQSLLIQRKPRASVLSNAEVCNGVDTLHLKKGRPRNGHFQGPGVDSNVFYLDSVNRKTGTYQLMYVFVDSVGCSDTANTKLFVYPTPSMTFLPLDSTCENVAEIQLKSNPTDSFWGPGVLGDRFHPGLAGLGSHRLTSTTTNKWNCSASDTQSIEVLAVTDASLSLLDTICTNGHAFKLSGGIPLGGYYVGPGIEDSAYFNPKLGNDTGSQKVRYVYVNENGCRDTASSQVFVLDTVSLAGPKNMKLCHDHDTLLLDLIKPAGGIYQWNGQPIETIIVKDESPGIYPLEYLLKSSNGCLSRTYLNIEILNAIEASIKAPTTICANAAPIEITDVSPMGGLLSGHGVKETIFMPAWAGVGFHWLKYAYADTFGCGAVDSALIQVLDFPKASLDFPEYFCENGVPIALRQQGSPSGGTYFINQSSTEWLVPNQLNQGQHRVSYVFESTNGCTDTASNDFLVYEAPTKPTIAQWGEALRTDADENLQWWLNGAPLSNADSSEITPLENGNYQVSTSNEHCTSFSDSLYFVLNTVSLGERMRIEVFPNPSHGPIHLTGLSPEKEYRIGVHTMTGQLISTVVVPSRLNDGRFTLSESLENGVYLITILDESGSIQKTPILIENDL